MDGRRLIRAAQVVDAVGRGARPGALLLDGDDVVVAGTPQEIGEPLDAEIVDLPDMCVVPAMVNAHAHLDLTHLGPRPFDGDFARWLDVILTTRAHTPEAIADSVRQGIALSHAGGTAVIGDIAGCVDGSPSMAPVHELRRSALVGVSYLEYFGQGRREPATVEAIERSFADAELASGGVRLGIQPHAPYSCGPTVYQAAARCGLPVSTHLAESIEEIEFSRTATGPIAAILQALGGLDETVRGTGLHPVDALADALAAAPFLCAHANYVEPEHLQLLRRWGATIAYCPRSSAYFGHPSQGHTPHQYLAMLDAGVNVALGTDSIVCLDTPDCIGVLDEMRFLYRRDGTDPLTLLHMATVAGAGALHVDQGLVTFERGPIAGVLAVRCDRAASDPLRDALGLADAPTWIHHHEQSFHGV